MNEEKQYKTFQAFWPFYVSQHLRAGNRAFHFVGTTLALGWFGHLLFVFPQMMFTSLERWWFMLMVFPIHFALMLLCGYGFAWAGHFFIEKNIPATFQHPIWSLVGDLKMYGLMWRGEMELEILKLEDLQRLIREADELLERIRITEECRKDGCQ